MATTEAIVLEVLKYVELGKPDSVSVCDFVLIMYLYLKSWGLCWLPKKRNGPQVERLKQWKRVTFGSGGWKPEMELLPEG